MSYVTDNSIRVFFSIVESGFVPKLPNSVEDCLNKKQEDSEISMLRTRELVKKHSRTTGDRRKR